MSIKRESLEHLKKRITQNYLSSLNPLEKTTRYNLIKIIAEVEAGIYHQLLGDIEFLSRQIFPDTAEGEYLRSHWADKVPPLYAESATGFITITGSAGVKIPSGCIFMSNQGNRYYTNESYKIGDDKTVKVFVVASEAGSDSNLSEGVVLNLASNLIAGMDTTAKVIEIAGGTNGESDEEYLLRVLNYLQVSNRYGRVGDFAAWAIDSSSEVTKAFESKNFAAFGALLVTVVGGDVESGFVKVYNTQAVKDYIDKVAPPVLFTVLSAEIRKITPTILLQKNEDTTENRERIQNALKLYFATAGKPNMIIYQAALEKIINDGEYINTAILTLENREIKLSVLEYPVLGEIIWA